MKAVGILLIVLGGLGLVCSFAMFGDIGIACFIGALAALISGIGFLLVSKAIQELKEKNR